MNSPSYDPQSLAAKASWFCLSLALGCWSVFLVFQIVDQVSQNDRTKQGQLISILPRTLLYGLWAGEALAVVVGIGSFLFLKREDTKSHAIIGTVTRSLCGISLGLFGVLFLWLYVGHHVIGF